VSGDAAPLLGSPDPRAAGYIVVFHDGTDADAATEALSAAHGFVPRHVFRHALLGFAAELSEDAVDAIRRDPAVKYVEHDGPVSIA
jgi:hypothetical protein